MTIQQKAKELGELIAQSQEAERLELANANYNLDAIAQNMVNEYNALQIKYKRMSNKMSKEEQFQAEAELKELKDSVESNPVVKESIEAQEAFNHLVNEVIEIINYSLGKDSFKTSSSGCGGCGGGCGTR